MSRYRNRMLKASAALWLLVLLADAGWAATSRAALTASVFMAVCVVISAVLFGKYVQNLRDSEAVATPIRNDRHR